MRTSVATLAAALLITSLGACQSSSSGAGRGAAPGSPAACAWHTQRSGQSGGDDLTGVSFPDLTHGWAVGGIDRADILSTTDGGATWRSQVVGDNGLSAVSFVDVIHGWAVGIHNTLLVTANGGRTWAPQNPHINQDGNLYGVQFVDTLHGWLVGQGGVIRVTADGGQTWIPRSAGTNQDVTQVAFTDPLHGWIVGDGVFRTADGGVTWSRVYAPHKSEAVVALSALDDQRAWESGSQDTPEHHYGAVSQTINGGRTWTHRVATAFDDVRFGTIAFVDNTHGWVFGDGGDVWYTDNGGITWGMRPTQTNGHRMLSTGFRDPTHGWAVGETGTILACTG